MPKKIQKRMLEKVGIEPTSEAGAVKSCSNESTASKESKAARALPMDHFPELVID